jgi:hypothetical protein
MSWGKRFSPPQPPPPVCAMCFVPLTESAPSVTKLGGVWRLCANCVRDHVAAHAAVKRSLLLEEARIAAEKVLIDGNPDEDA